MNVTSLRHPLIYPYIFIRTNPWPCQINLYWNKLLNELLVSSVVLLVWPVEGGANNTRHPVVNDKFWPVKVAPHYIDIGRLCIWNQLDFGDVWFRVYWEINNDITSLNSFRFLFTILICFLTTLLLIKAFQVMPISGIEGQLSGAANFYSPSSLALES